MRGFEYLDPAGGRVDDPEVLERIAFGAALPRLRRRVARDLQLPSDGRQVEVGQLTERRVLALAVRLLDLGFFRIGSEDYAERNESYGLTTMLREHVTVEEREVIFRKSRA